MEEKMREATGEKVVIDAEDAVSYTHLPAQNI